jgi:hypothetical protein
VYIDADDWSTGLRQGDVVGPIIIPLVARDIQIVASATNLTEPAPEQAFTQLLIRGENRLAVVASHDCEFNESKRNKFLIARVQAVPGNLTPEELDRLRESNDVQALLEAHPTATVAGVDSFVLHPIPGSFDTEHVVNFATITALPMAMKTGLRAAKRAEMTADDRGRFQRKLAWFFGRTTPVTEDEPVAQAEDPR